MVAVSVYVSFLRTSARSVRRSSQSMPGPLGTVAFVARAGSVVGHRVGTHPVAVIAWSLVTCLICSCGLFFASFVTEPQKLYVPQHSEMAQRRRFTDTFALVSKPAVIIASAREAGENVLSHGAIEEVFALHRLVMLASGENGTRYTDLCYARYFAAAQSEICCAMSVLRLWWFRESSFQLDASWERTIVEGFKAGFFSPSQPRLLDGGKRLAASALSMDYTLRPVVSRQELARLVSWESSVLKDIALFNEYARFIRATYWSEELTTREAAGLTFSDLGVAMLSVACIMVFVTIGLDGCALRGRGSRWPLAIVLGLCAVLSLTSGFGISAAAGVPLAPSSTLVVILLLGLAADDMVNLCDAWDRTSPALAPEERLARAMSAAGPAVAMTTLTTMLASIAGIFVDLPAIQLFSIPAASCMLMINFLQLTLFAACLVLREGKAPPPMAVMEGSGGGSRGCGESSLARWWVTSVVPFILSPIAAPAILILFLAAIVAAGFTLPHLQVGLPIASTLPVTSEVSAFIRDLKAGWHGDWELWTTLVFLDVDLGNATQVSAMRAALKAISNLPFIRRIEYDWMADYVAFLDCMSLKATGMHLDKTEPISFEGFAAWLTDGAVYLCPKPGDRSRGHRPTAAESPPGFVGSAFSGHRHELLGAMLAESLNQSKGYEVLPPLAEPEPHAEVRLRASQRSAAECVDADDIFLRITGGQTCAQAASSCGEVPLVDAYCRRTCHCKGKGPQFLPPGVDISVAFGGLTAAVDVQLEDPMHVKACRFFIRQRMPEVLVDSVEQYEAIDEAIRRVGAKVLLSGRVGAVALEHSRGRLCAQGWAYNFDFEFAASDSSMPTFCAGNMVEAAAVVFAACALFLSPRVAVLCLLTVAATDLLTIGAMALGGLRLNCMTSIILLITLGTAVDYSCHVGLAFNESSHGPSRERVGHAPQRWHGAGTSVFERTSVSPLAPLDRLSRPRQRSPAWDPPWSAPASRRCWVRSASSSARRPSSSPSSS